MRKMMLFALAGSTAAFSMVAPMGRAPAIRVPRPVMLAPDEMTSAQLQMQLDILQKQIELTKLREQLAAQSAAAAEQPRWAGRFV